MAVAIALVTHAPASASCTVIAIGVCAVTVGAMRIVNASIALASGATGAAVRLGATIVTPGVVVETVMVVLVSAAMPPLAIVTRSWPVSPASRMPSVSQVTPASVIAIGPTPSLPRSEKSSTTPSRLVDVRAGDAAHEPAPRTANAWASAIVSVGSSAWAAASSASRASVKVASLGVSSRPATT